MRARMFSSRGTGSFPPAQTGGRWHFAAASIYRPVPSTRFEDGKEKRGQGDRPRPASSPMGAARMSGEIAQTAQTDSFAANKRFAIGRADGPAPVAAAGAEIVQQSRKGGRPAG